MLVTTDSLNFSRFNRFVEILTSVLSSQLFDHEIPLQAAPEPRGLFINDSPKRSAIIDNSTSGVAAACMKGC
ncbi:hypothetical protein BTK96_000337 [Burkholderia pyrrocinia]|uniref:hypothetical protein n=1 Tax=Burkholderia sp. IT-111MI5 TaxID=3026439 RepID=UPI002A2DF3C4|nr:hypothetical protein [Burkholderia pyrrocinia]EKS9893139.1 hypothetical protein [Burkholderia pyrrocinia]EKS9908913.1 hypothetical protein [Burkholderia pyrrocinia]